MTRLQRHRTAGPLRTASPPFQILCLSGGGFRGLFTAAILEHLELETGKPLRESFDLVAGTSIGGIIACGIACGIPASTIRKEFERLGASVFDRRLKLFGRRFFDVPRVGLFASRYSQDGLVAAIDGVLKDRADIALSEVGQPLLVPAVSATSGTSVLFESGSFAGRYAGTTLRDVALATSAAPTYFPEHTLGENSLLDGGIVANAPDAVAILKALSSFGRRPEEIRVLSIGTVAEAAGEVHRPNRASGAVSWMLTRDLFGLTLAAQQELSIALAKELLGRRFIRIDFKPDKSRGGAIALDKAGLSATVTLKGLAKQSLDEAHIAYGAELQSMLRHAAPKGAGASL